MYSAAYCRREFPCQGGAKAPGALSTSVRKVGNLAGCRCGSILLVSLLFSNNPLSFSDPLFMREGGHMGDRREWVRRWGGRPPPVSRQRFGDRKTKDLLPMTPPEEKANPFSYCQAIYSQGERCFHLKTAVTTSSASKNKSGKGRQKFCLKGAQNFFSLYNTTPT